MNMSDRIAAAKELIAASDIWEKAETQEEVDSALPPFQRLRQDHATDLARFCLEQHERIGALEAGLRTMRDGCNNCDGTGLNTFDAPCGVCSAARALLAGSPTMNYSH